MVNYISKVGRGITLLIEGSPGYGKTLLAKKGTKAPLNSYMINNLDVFLFFLALKISQFFSKFLLIEKPQLKITMELRFKGIELLSKTVQPRFLNR